MILESLHTCTETVSVLLVYKVHEVLSKTRFTTPAATNRSEDKVQQSYLSSVLGREVIINELLMLSLAEIVIFPLRLKLFVDSRSQHLLFHFDCVDL